jgi:short-subunit dehydrogenase
MAMKLKRLDEQVIVITGATSGIGLVTARKAAERGAKLVLAARNEDALSRLVYELKEYGRDSTYVAADVGNEGDVNKIAAEALNKFGNFDTWINNAGVSIYGKIEDIDIADFRRLFETNFWGVVYGSIIAARNLKIYGGAIINIGSTLSDRAIPLQGMYSASKHAVKGFTDALRMELEAENSPISVTLIKPSMIDTPYFEHAKNYVGTEPVKAPMIYSPDAVADTILYCVENPVRDVFVGASGKMLSVMGEYAPRITDKIFQKVMLGDQTSGMPANGKDKEGLYRSADSDLHERGPNGGHVAAGSFYTTASLHPVVTSTAALAVGAGLAYSLFKRSQSH